MSQFEHRDGGFTFRIAPLDSFSSRQVAVIIRTPEHAANATGAYVRDGLVLQEPSNGYPVVFVQTRQPLALAAFASYPCRPAGRRTGGQ